MKKSFPNIPFIHRVDGPICLYRNSRSRFIDKLIFSLNQTIADGTIFQSKFSLKENRKLGIPKQKFETIISNAPDSKLFFPKKIVSEKIANRKVRLISISWSDNTMKGFDTYRYLDESLDFSKHEYTFIGNSPVTFKNIRIIPPIPSQKIAEYLRESDIYITASQKDPCSNSLIEALSCGLPSIALNDGGHPEILRGGGEIFNTNEEIRELIRIISEKYAWYQENIPSINMGEIAMKYKKFFETVSQNLVKPKKMHTLNSMGILAQSWFV